MVGEPAPNPDSRVMLSEDRDSLGLNRPRLDWRLAAKEKRSMAELLKVIGREFGRLDIGRVKLDDWLTDDQYLAHEHAWRQPSHGHHPHGRRPEEGGRGWELPHA